MREKRGIISKKPVLLNARTGPSALPLLVALVAAADHVDHAATPDHLAVLADTLNRRTNFHDCFSLALSRRPGALLAHLAGPAVAAQVGLLHEPLVLVRHEVRLQLGHEVHDHHHDDHE